MSGRRAPSMAIMGGLGLLGLLLTVAIMAVLVNRVLSDTSDPSDGDPRQGLAVPTTVAPGAASSTGVAPEAGGGVALPGATDDLNAAACQVNRSTLEVAAQAHELQTGAPPADQQALVDAGALLEPIPGFELTGGPDGVQVTGVGECAGQ